MQRADARSVCTAFSAALARHGVPDQLLTDNGRVFTGRLTRPHPAVVLFDRICQQQGIRHLLTKPAHPTTTGKIERFHRTLRVELLDNASFTSLEAARQGINAYVVKLQHRAAAPGPGHGHPGRALYIRGESSCCGPATD
jgi:transposase InsO family protein